MTEIKKELKGDNISVKANAISKLTYVRPRTRVLIETSTYRRGVAQCDNSGVSYAF